MGEVKMKSIREMVGTRAALAAVLGFSMAGCGAPGEDLGLSQEALTWGSWAPIPASPNADQYGATVVTKRNSSTFYAMTVPCCANSLQQVSGNVILNSFTPWIGVATAVSTKPGSTSWFGPSGIEALQNVLTAYGTYNAGSGFIDLKLGYSPYDGGTYSWSTMAGSATNSFSGHQPTLAYSNGWLYLFVQKPDNTVMFKRNNVGTGFNASGWSASWTALGAPTWKFTGIAAAASGFDTITLLASDAVGSGGCFGMNLTASTASTITGWGFIGSCALTGYSTPALTPTGAAYTGSARMAVLTTDAGGSPIIKTALGNGTSWSAPTVVKTTGCTPVSNPAITQTRSNEELVVATTCNASPTVISYIKGTMP
jgi:hypothetical protein